MMQEGERWPEHLGSIDVGDPHLANEIAHRWNHFQPLPEDVKYDPVRDSLKVGETEFSLAFLRFFGKHSIGISFRIIDTDYGISIERL